LQTDQVLLKQTTRCML